MKIGGVYILSRRSIARMLAVITAALMTLYAAATAPFEDMVRRIHDVAGGLLSLDRQMVGRLMRTVVPDILYLEYKSLYLEVKASGAAVAGRAARRDASPHHGRVALLRDRRQDGGSPCGRLAEDGSPHHAAATVEDIQRAVEEMKQTVRTAKREIIKDAHTARTSEADRRVPTGERARQIGNVHKIVREARAAGKRMSILRACRKAWQDVKGGYPAPEALYDYCHSHRTEF